MRYGQGFWVVENGVRLPRPVYPETQGFDYNDGTGDKGEFLLSDFTVDYCPPGWNRGNAIRMTVSGACPPVLHENAFDFDFASVPKIFRSLICDKADHRIRVASLFHDMGFCVHEVLSFTDRGFWNTMLTEVMEAYCEHEGWRGRRDTALRAAVGAGVAVGGPFCWAKTPEEIAAYRRLFKIEFVPL